MEIDCSFDGLVSTDVRNCFVMSWYRGVETRSCECAGEYVVVGARLNGEEPDLFSLAIECSVSIHLRVVSLAPSLRTSGLFEGYEYGHVRKRMDCTFRPLSRVVLSHNGSLSLASLACLMLVSAQFRGDAYSRQAAARQLALPEARQM